MDSKRKGTQRNAQRSAKEGFFFAAFAKTFVAFASIILRRYLRVLIVGLSLGAPFCLTHLKSLEAQNQSPSATRVRPNEGAIIGGPNASASSVTPPTLQCQGCHGPGKTLPYLGGALFHTEPHADYDRGFHAQAIQFGNKAATCLDCHTLNGDMATILPASDPKSTINRANIAETCGRCHGDKSVMQGSGISNRPFLSYRESVHAKAIARGNMNAAVCTDCHNSHDIRPASDMQSSIFRVNIPKTCGRCHQAEANDFAQSVHGEAIARGVSRAPVCTDCHGIHNIKLPFDQNTAAVSPVVGTESCANCHEGVTLAQEFGVPSGRVTSYRDSYHGLASKLGSRVVANCASCHGVHNILPSSDPRSMINPDNLPRTCGQCHVGASVNFAKGKVHLGVPVPAEAGARDFGAIGTRWIRRFYLCVIFITIGGMLLHNALVLRKKAVVRPQRQEHRTIIRLTRKQRLQHWLLLLSFFVLVISGFALKYPDSWLAWLLLSSEPLRRITHRVAAVVLLAVGAYHVGYLVLTKEGRDWTRDILPRRKDFKDLVQNVHFYLGAKVSRPKIARFGYQEKVEYWAVIWGTIIMGLTGLMIWFKIGIFGFLPRWWIDIALAVHFYEAVLATLAITVWHFYAVIFDPDVYPLNRAFLDGRVSEELYQEEHELDFERMKGAESAEPETEAIANSPVQATDH